MVENTRGAVDRRALLRRAGAVAVGVGAAAVATGVVASPAQAAVGSPVTAGETVDAVDASTGITNNSATKPTLALTNTSGPALRLAPVTQSISPDAPQGSFNALTGGYLEYQALPGVSADVYTSATATQTWAVNPFRALDTRGLGGITGNGRELILNLDALDSSHRLKGGSTLLINLTPYVKYGWAVVGNATVQAPQASGFITVYPAGVTRPNTSSVNFLQGWPISNAVFCALGENGNAEDQTDVIQIYSPVTTHVLFDVTGFVVPTYYNINPAVMPGGSSSSSVSPHASGSGKSRADRVRAYRPKH